jgi:hypothetical protein
MVNQTAMSGRKAQTGDEIMVAAYRMEIKTMCRRQNRRQMAHTGTLFGGIAARILRRGVVLAQQRTEQRGAVFIAVAGQAIGVAAHKQGKDETEGEN